MMEVQLGSPDRIDAYADLFATGFADDELITWPLRPGDGEALAREQWLPLGRGMLDAGWLWEAPAALGIAAWVPPDGAAGLLDMDARWVEAVRSLTDDEGVRLEALWGWIEGQLPAEPHWFLDHIAVAAEHRGEGIGSALVRFGLDRASTDGVCAFLETSRERNVPIYEHLGFRVVLAEPAPGDGPVIWFMRWDQT
jgi:GNAT superfamily N-acetyltransferase